MDSLEVLLLNDVPVKLFPGEPIVVHENESLQFIKLERLMEHLFHSYLQAPIYYILVCVRGQSNDGALVSIRYLPVLIEHL